MLLPASIDDYVSPADPVRAIDAFVDHLDLAPLGFKVRDEGSEGRSSYHPGTLLKLYLWGYLKRTRSSRGLEAACAENLQVIWLTRNLRPDHSTIAQFRKDHPAPLKAILRQFNLVCFELQLFGKELVAIDGTFIKAVNSTARSFTRAKLGKLIASIDEAIDRYTSALAEADASCTPQQSGECGVEELRRKLDKIRERKVVLEGHRDRCAESPTGQVNLTDPDCRQLRKGGKTTVGYNVQAAVDDKHHLIATIGVTQDANDQHSLDPVCQQAKEDLGLPANSPLTAIADTGYGTGAQHAACERHGTIALTPVQKNHGETNGLYNNNSFVHDPASDTCVCPQGKVLARKADKKGGSGGEFRCYYNTAACRGCPVRAECTRGKYRKLLISEHEEVLVRARRRIASSPGIMRKRAGLVEHAFGTIKDRHGHGGVLCRGLELAVAEMNLSAWAYNFTRVMNLVGMDRLLEAIRTRLPGRRCGKKALEPRKVAAPASHKRGEAPREVENRRRNHRRVDRKLHPGVGSIFRQPLKPTATILGHYAASEPDHRN
jgi:transposase